MKQHSKITAWLHKPVPTITVDASSDRASRASDIEEIHSFDGDVVEINGNAKKYTEDSDAPNTSTQTVVHGNGNHKDYVSTKDQYKQSNVAKDSKMCTIL